MKTLNDYMAMSYRMEIIEDKDEGGFVVSYPELPGCVTCGKTVEDAVANALDAKKAWIEAALAEKEFLVKLQEAEEAVKDGDGWLTMDELQAALEEK